MTSAIYDIPAIAKRRDQLFRTISDPDAWHDYERYGTTMRHCGICPEKDGQVCHLSCEKQRGALNDGVTVG